MNNDENEKQLWRFFRSVTTSQFAAFMLEKNIDILKCRMCDGNDIAIPTMSDVSVEGEPSHLIPVRVSSMSFNSDYFLTNYTYRVLCKDCGCETYFNAFPVINWITNRQADEE